MSAQDDLKKSLLDPSATEYADEVPSEPKPRCSRDMKLYVAFVLMVIVGCINGVTNTCSTVPLRHYPFFVTTWSTFIYVPVSFAYVIPMIKWGKAISKEEQMIPKHKFAVMGVLDSLAGLMQTFGGTFIVNGSLVVMLQQTAIPMSMFITYFMLKSRYNLWQYVGALFVFGGLAVVLFAPGSDDDGGSSGTPAVPMLGLTAEQTQWVWCAVIVMSCVPMTLSSVYKEIALGEAEIDAMYLNGWIALFQFLMSIPLSVPSVYVTKYSQSCDTECDMEIFKSFSPIPEIPRDMYQGFLCYLGMNSLPNDKCALAPIFLNIYLAFNIWYNVLIILMLKYGSSNLMWIASTVMVPLNSFAFAIPHLPKSHKMQWRDAVGFVVIMTGLIAYRFGSQIFNAVFGRCMKTTPSEQQQVLEDAENIWKRATRYISVNPAGMGGMSVIAAAPVITYDREQQIAKLNRNIEEVRSKYLGRLGIRDMPLMMSSGALTPEEV